MFVSIITNMFRTFQLQMKGTNMTKLNLLNFETDVQSLEVQWLWNPYIPYGKITIIQGDPGCGKTMFISYLLSELSKGKDFNNSDNTLERITCILNNAEDGLEDTLKPRLEMFKADCNYIYSIDETSDPLSMQDTRIEEAILKTNAKVVVLDPIQAYLGAQVDMHRANEVRPILKQLGNIAKKYNCAMILVGHMNKGTSKAMYRGVGSIDFAAAARSILTLGKVKDNQDVRVLLHTKSSLAPAGSPLAFSLTEEDGFTWLGEYDISEDDLLAGNPGSNKLNQAMELINALVSNGPITTNDMMQQAKDKGIGKTTMNAAKEKLQIKSVRMNDMWYWSK